MTNPLNASRMASPAKIKATANVASAGTISRRPERTMMMENTATASANHASRPDHVASRDIGTSKTGPRAIPLIP